MAEMVSAGVLVLVAVAMLGGAGYLVCRLLRGRG